MAKLALAVRTDGCKLGLALEEVALRESAPDAEHHVVAERLSPLFLDPVTSWFRAGTHEVTVERGRQMQSIK
jgi:hypothetical protein